MPGWKSQEQVKIGLYSFLIITCSFFTPLSFSYFLQQKVNLILSFLFSSTFILLILIFSYMKQNAQSRYQKQLKDLKKGTVLKKKNQDGQLYEITQESSSYVYLHAVGRHHKLMISKDRLSKEFESQN